MELSSTILPDKNMGIRQIEQKKSSYSRKQASL